MQKKYIYRFVILCFWCLKAKAQDPHFSQFFLVPSLINPAMTGSNISDWRAMTNYRQQWGNFGTPFNTFTLFVEGKLLNKKQSGNTLYGSQILMSEKSMNGGFVSTYLTSTLSDFQKLNENGRLGIGFSISYGQRSIDYGQLNFGEQFTNGGFNNNLPTGETALTNMKSFFSFSAGIMYNHHIDDFDMDIGVAVFNLNTPKQSFINDPDQLLPRRYAANLNLEYVASDFLSVNMNTIFQAQAKVSYINTGASLGFDVSQGERNKILYTGLWYRVGDAIIPYVGLQYDNIHFGFTYDIGASNKFNGTTTAGSYEFSIIINQQKMNPGAIRCPWK